MLKNNGTYLWRLVFSFKEGLLNRLCNVRLFKMLPYVCDWGAF